MDPRLRIHTKMSWIQNTGTYLYIKIFASTDGRLLPYTQYPYHAVFRIQIRKFFGFLDLEPDPF